VAPGHDGWRKAALRRHCAFSETDFTDDLKKITVPVLVMHSEDHQIVPYVAAGAAVRQALEERNPENLQGLPARHPTTEVDRINADLLAFTKKSRHPESHRTSRRQEPTAPAVAAALTG
jgi:non-heme chloroperoxidase